MRRVVPWTIALALCSTTFAENPKPSARPIVRTQLVKSAHIAADPRDTKTIGSLAGPAWMAYDKHGYLSEVGGAVNGTPVGVERRKLDARGRAVETVNDSGTTGFRSEYKDGPFGAVEEDQYLGEALVKKTLNQYDARGRCISTETFDANGQQLVSVKYQFDAQGHPTQIVTQTWTAGDPQPKTYYRQDDSYNADGSLRERVEYDRDGEAVRSITLGSDFQVSTWWSKPGQTFTQPLYAGYFNPETKVNTNYEVTLDGHLFKTVESHDTAADVDSIQRFDESGNLIEKLTFRYERDSAGNWTKRTVAAWDPKTDAMVDIQEDTRTLTYY